MTPATTTHDMILTIVSSTGQILTDSSPILPLVIGICFVGFAMVAILGSFKVFLKKIIK